MHQMPPHCFFSLLVRSISIRASKTHLG